MSTPLKRNSRKVSGGAKGNPNLAIMKPVLHNNTNSIGMNATARLEKLEPVFAPMSCSFFIKAYPVLVLHSE
jgi:hypothetical protein